MKWISRIAGFAGFAGFLLAQPNSSQFNVIPKADNTPGYVKFWGQKMNVPGFSVTLTPPAGLTADYTLTLPDTPMDGFIYYDSMTGLLSFTGAGTCGVDCMTLTTAQNASGIKTFQNGIIMQNASFIDPGGFLTIGASGGLSTIESAGQTNWYNGSGVARVLISQAGGASTVSGIVRTFNATDTINSLDPTGIFSAVGFNVGTYASKIPIVDAAGLVTPVSFQLTTGATNGFCLVSDAAGVGTWQACSAGGSFITTNTLQAGLTGDKSTNGLWTFSNAIMPGTANTFDQGSNAVPWRVAYSQFVSTENVEIVSSGRTDLWRLKYGSALKTLELYSGAGSQLEISAQVFGSTQTQWGFRGTLYPLNVGGANGDIGFTGSRWRDAWFSGTITTDTTNSTLYLGNTITLSGFAPSIGMSGGRTAWNAGSFVGYDSTLTNIKLLMSWLAIGGPGLVRTFTNSGTYVAGLEAAGVVSNLGYSIGDFSTSTIVIDATGKGIFPAFQLTAAPSAGYIMTSDASGNGTWQAPAGGSFVTTNTNQAGLSGTKDWSNTHTFNGGMAVKLTSTARHWYPESDDAYDLGSDGPAFTQRWANIYSSDSATTGIYNGTRTEHTPGISRWYNGSNIGRVLISNAGGVSTTVSGIVRTTNVAGTVNSMDSNGIQAESGFFVGPFPGTQVIDGSRNTNFALIAGSGLSLSGNMTGTNITISGTMSASGNVFGGLGSFSALTLNVGIPVVGYCWTATSSGGVGAWQACGTGSFITASSSQSGLSGDKQTTGIWTWGSGSGGIRGEADGTNGRFTVLNGSGAVRARMNQAGAFGSGTVATFTGSAGSETINNSMSNSGISTTVAYIANGFTGISLTCSGGNTVRNPVYVFGILVSGSCAP